METAARKAARSQVGIPKTERQGTIRCSSRCAPEGFQVVSRRGRVTNVRRWGRGTVSVMSSLLLSSSRVIFLSKMYLFICALQMHCRARSESSSRPLAVLTCQQVLFEPSQTRSDPISCGQLQCKRKVYGS